MSAAKDSAIRSILSGNLYQTKTPLSDRVWDLTNNNLKDINSIIARGIAMNQSVNDIALQLEKYLKPSKNLGWNTQLVNGKVYQVHNRIFRHDRRNGLWRWNNRWSRTL